MVWVFAEREVTQQAVNPFFVELISKKPDFLVELLDARDQPAISNTQQIRLTVEGPAGRLQILDQGIREPLPPFDLAETFYEDIVEEESVVKELQIVEDLFPNELLYKEAYLNVLEADPATFTVRLSKMRLDDVPIKVYGVSGELSGATVNPETVKAYVLPDRFTEARVVLKPAQQTQATQKEITVNCQVDHPDPEANYQVKVSFPEEASPLQDFEISPARLGCLLPISMTGKYEVVIDDINILKEKITGQGTTLAIEAYRNSSTHLELEIYENDIPNELIPRKATYHLPPAHAGEIIIEKNPNLLLQFRLIPIPEAESIPEVLAPILEGP
jgi:hypothetical protein